MLQNSYTKEISMKKIFMIPQIELISFSNADIITTSSGENGGNVETNPPIGPGGDIGLPFDPFF